MHEDLQQLARELRKETCPQRVLDEVARRISAQAPERGHSCPQQGEAERGHTKCSEASGAWWLLRTRMSALRLSCGSALRYGIAAALAASIMLCGIALWRWPIGRGSPHAPEVSQKEVIDRVRVARQVEGTFAYIGQVMVDASAHSERVILNDAVPQLRNSLETAKNKIMNHIEL